MLNRWFGTPALHRDLFQTFFSDDLFQWDRRLEWNEGSRFTVHDDGEQVVLRGELPGMTEKDLSITVENGEITIRGERTTNLPEGYRALRRERAPIKFAQTFAMAKEMNLEAVEAELTDGMLTLRIPKRPKTQPRQIQIKAGGAS
jgi:HSP20 family protein